LLKTPHVSVVVDEWVRLN